MVARSIQTDKFVKISAKWQLEVYKQTDLLKYPLDGILEDRQTGLLKYPLDGSLVDRQTSLSKYPLDGSSK